MTQHEAIDFDPDSIPRLSGIFGVGAAEIARRSGLKRQRVEKWLTKSCRPNAQALAALHNAFGVPLAFFYKKSSKPVCFGLQ